MRNAFLESENIRSGSSLQHLSKMYKSMPEPNPRRELRLRKLRYNHSYSNRESRDNP